MEGVKGGRKSGRDRASPNEGRLRVRVRVRRVDGVAGECREGEWLTSCVTRVVVRRLGVRRNDRAAGGSMTDRLTREQRASRSRTQKHRRQGVIRHRTTRNHTHRTQPHTISPHTQGHHRESKSTSR